MNITTKEQLQEQQRSKDTCWLITDTMSEEVVIERIPYLYNNTYGSSKVGDVVLVKGDGEKVTFKLELDKPIEGIVLSTEPDTSKDVRHLARLENPTVEQVNEVIKKYRDSHDEHFGYDVQERKFILGLGEVELLEQVGGEGEGDHYHVVFKVGEKMFELDAFYSSWEGTEFDDEAYEVKPKEVKVTQYERV